MNVRSGAEAAQGRKNYPEMGAAAIFFIRKKSGRGKFKLQEDAREGKSLEGTERRCPDRSEGITVPAEKESTETHTQKADRCPNRYNNPGPHTHSVRSQKGPRCPRGK